MTRIEWTDPMGARCWMTSHSVLDGIRLDGDTNVHAFAQAVTAVLANKETRPELLRACPEIAQIGKETAWAAYVGAEEMLKASGERERIIQDHRKRACEDAQWWKKQTEEAQAKIVQVTEALAEKDKRVNDLAHDLFDVRDGQPTHLSGKMRSEAGKQALYVRNGIADRAKKLEAELGKVWPVVEAAKDLERANREMYGHERACAAVVAAVRSNYPRATVVLAPFRDDRTGELRHTAVISDNDLPDDEFQNKYNGPDAEGKTVVMGVAAHVEQPIVDAARRVIEWQRHLHAETGLAKETFDAWLPPSLQALARAVEAGLQAPEEVPTRDTVRPTDPAKCPGCSFENEFGTEECPHPVDAEAHACIQSLPGGVPLWKVGDVFVSGVLTGNSGKRFRVVPQDSRELITAGSGLVKCEAVDDGAPWDIDPKFHQRLSWEARAMYAEAGELAANKELAKSQHKRGLQRRELRRLNQAIQVHDAARIMVYNTLRLREDGK